MCGIFICVSKKKKLNIEKCHRAFSNLIWRGTDHSFYKIFKNRIFFGQTILSINGNNDKISIESSSISSSKRYHISYNGEIYNYKQIQKDLNFNKFINDTKTLVDLHDYLEFSKIPDRLDGMFAYVVYDTIKHLLHIVRDPQGEKCLYKYEDNNVIIISSQISPIFPFYQNKKIDYQVIKDYFYTRHLMQSKKTVYKNIHQIHQGSVLTYDCKKDLWNKDKSYSLFNLIDPSIMEKNKHRSLNDLTDELDQLMRENVKSMLPKKRKYSSVVSGGIDSSLISYYVNELGSPNSLIGVNHIGKDRISNNLVKFEKIYKRKINTINVNADIYSSEILRCQKLLSSPLLSHAFVAQSLQSQFVNLQNSKVLFGGEGGDELFGGYADYAKNFNYYNRNFSPSRYTNLLDNKLKFKKINLNSLQNELTNTWKKSLKAYNHIKNKSERISHSMMLADTALQLSSVGLRLSDLMSMMWSVEARSIYLRKSILKFSLNLPFFAKIDRLNKDKRLITKVLLKNLFLRYFPNKLLYLKQGFAGFPNESGKFLGDIDSYIFFKKCEIKNKKAIYYDNNFWKIINTEYFLRDIN